MQKGKLTAGRMMSYLKRKNITASYGQFRSTQEIADVFHYSKFHVSRILKGLMKEEKVIAGASLEPGKSRKRCYSLNDIGIKTKSEAVYNGKKIPAYRVFTLDENYRILGGFD